MYTRANPQRYQNQWQRTTVSPTHQDWQALLQREAAVMTQAQGRNRLTVIVGDSLALWMPPEALPQNRFWLNQSISGETTSHMLRRLHYFANARPDTIHIMAGINDLKQGASEDSVVRNLQQMVGRLRQQHPQAQIVVHSILPTRWESLPSDQIQRVNGRLAQLAQQPGVSFVDLQTTFADDQGQLRRELTTDGLHLSRQGYAVWRTALVSY
jgi:lysophospholipase L1-like esterase